MALWPLKWHFTTQTKRTKSDVWMSRGCGGWWGLWCPVEGKQLSQSHSRRTSAALRQPRWILFISCEVVFSGLRCLWRNKCNQEVGPAESSSTSRCFTGRQTREHENFTQPTQSLVCAKAFSITFETNAQCTHFYYSTFILLLLFSWKRKKNRNKPFEK